MAGGCSTNGTRALPHSTASAAPIWLAAQALRDPGNLGTIVLRTADAVGAGGLILIGRLRRSLQRRSRAAPRMGAVFTVGLGAGAVGGVPAVACAAERASWSRQKLARCGWLIAGRITARRASFWSATNRKGLPERLRGGLRSAGSTMPMKGRADSPQRCCCGRGAGLRGCWRAWTRPLDKL